MDRREVSAARDVVLGRLQRARPEILEVLDAVLAVGFGVVELHRRQMTGVAVISTSLHPIDLTDWLERVSFV